MIYSQQGVSAILRQCITNTAILSLITCTACSAMQAQNNPRDSPTPTETVTSSQIVALGKLIPEGDVIKISVVNAQDSRVNQILVKEGDFVRANQLIALLQGQNKAEQQLREAQANVAIKRSQLLRTQQGDFKQGEILAQQAAIAELTARLRTETKQRQATIAQAEATMRNAQIKYQRYVTLAEEGAIKRSELDDAQEEFDRAKAILAQNQAELDNTTSTLEAQINRENANLKRLQEVRPVDVDIAKAELQQAQIQVEQRKAELEDSQVRVPVAGQILRINTRVGEQVNTQEGIAELGQTKQMYAIAEVYETDIVKVKLGQPVIITSEYGGFSGEIGGKVAQIGLQIGRTRLNQDQNNPTNDVNARVVEVKIRINSEDSPKVAALTGMQVRVKIDVL
ncbi:HlyD family efflux transporter periplasmic adaptor subunit [Anabaena subtropica]|uniref:HlyD family efflux transporter periplasmic adaptor subunit n=1 Tax=Anabaena subtropica FACHB-260 TaxID=2692884 RepID=A0ABR8CWN3_9NOST|nr:HlyD family efflux transporter periplasmic adaptor subunit [Anabaena subtropica]MBD2347186.1 HlyD family efflux transporter periplasmic adaptor subunit [Anabaena subtropica FACHB-260]